MLLTAVIIELILLYLLSSRLTTALYRLFFSIFKNKNIASGIVIFFYLPGTVIHEFAHLLTAEILRVPTGEISFSPKIENEKKDSHEIKMGSVQIAQTDPFRKLLIGIAPVLFGLFFLFLLTWLFQNYYPQMQATWHKAGLILCIGYFLFAVSNNMFSSDSDIKDTWFLPLILIIILVSLYFAGVRIELTGKLLQIITDILSGLATSLGIVLVINALVLTINLLILKNIHSRHS